MDTIAIIDDDIHIGNMLERLLTKEGYKTLRAYSGTEALMLLSREQPDLVLLDLMLPGLSGEDILPKIKNIPVIIISAKTDIDNKVNLLLGGAMDYVTKPFDTKELLARIAVQMRKRKVTDTGDYLVYDKLRLDMDSRQVLIEDVPVRLTKTEFAILKLLMQNQSQVITKSRILDMISLDTPDCTESSLKIHVSNLRKKLRDITEVDYIEAVWGIGFKMREV